MLMPTITAGELLTIISMVACTTAIVIGVRTELKGLKETVSNLAAQLKIYEGRLFDLALHVQRLIGQSMAATAVQATVAHGDAVDAAAHLKSSR